MSGTGIDLSAYKPVAGNPVQAAPISNAMTLIESFTAASLDPAALLQKAAVAGQALVWDGTKWAPSSSPAGITAPTFVMGPGSASSASTVSINVAYLMPIPNIVVPTPISRIGFSVVSGGGTGNVDVGIYYSDDEVTFTRLVSKGSTVTPAGQAAVLTVPVTTITPVVGRRWYFAFACSNITPTFASFSAGTVALATFTKAASFPLPASLTSVSAPAGNQFFIYGMV